MTFLLKEMYFRNEDELTQFISQYEIKFTDDKSVIDCKASQTAISQQKLLQQLANWKYSVAHFRLTFTHHMHKHSLRHFISYQLVTHIILGDRKIPQSFKHRAKFFVFSWFWLKLSRRAAVLMIPCSISSLMLKSPISFLMPDLVYRFPVVSFRTLFCKTCARSGRNWLWRKWSGSEMVSNETNVSSRRYSWYGPKMFVVCLQFLTAMFSTSANFWLNCVFGRALYSRAWPPHFRADKHFNWLRNASLSFTSLQRYYLLSVYFISSHHTYFHNVINQFIPCKHTHLLFQFLLNTFISFAASLCARW